MVHGKVHRPAERIERHLPVVAFDRQRALHAGSRDIAVVRPHRAGDAVRHLKHQADLRAIPPRDGDACVRALNLERGPDRGKRPLAFLVAAARTHVDGFVHVHVDLPVGRGRDLDIAARVLDRKRTVGGHGPRKRDHPLFRVAVAVEGPVAVPVPRGESREPRGVAHQPQSHD